MSHCRIFLESVGGKKYFKCDSFHLNLDVYDQLDELHPQGIYFPPLTTKGVQVISSGGDIILMRIYSLLRLTSSLSSFYPII